MHVRVDEHQDPYLVGVETVEGVEEGAKDVEEVAGEELPERFHPRLPECVSALAPGARLIRWWLPSTNHQIPCGTYN